MLLQKDLNLDVVMGRGWEGPKDPGGMGQAGKGKAELTPTISQLEDISTP